MWLSSVARSCATQDDVNKDNVCTPTISPEKNRPPHPDHLVYTLCFGTTKQRHVQHSQHLAEEYQYRPDCNSSSSGILEQKMNLLYYKYYDNFRGVMSLRGQAPIVCMDVKLILVFSIVYTPKLTCPEGEKPIQRRRDC